MGAWWSLAEGSAEDRVAAAALPCTDARAVRGYEALARDYDPRIRRALAQNPGTPAAVLEDLAHDPDTRTRGLARSRHAGTKSASAEAVAFHARLHARLDDTPHADVTRAARRRPGWISPEHASPEIVRVAAKHGVRVAVHPGTIPGAHGVIEIDTIRVSQRGQGRGTEGLRAITALADRHGWALALHPSGDLGSDVERLRRWYRREGFEPSADPRLRRNLADWVRYPRG